MKNLSDYIPTLSEESKTKLAALNEFSPYLWLLTGAARATTFNLPLPQTVIIGVAPACPSQFIKTFETTFGDKVLLTEKSVTVSLDEYAIHFVLTDITEHVSSVAFAGDAIAFSVSRDKPIMGIEFWTLPAWQMINPVDDGVAEDVLSAYADELKEFVQKVNSQGQPVIPEATPEIQLELPLDDALPQK